MTRNNNVDKSVRDSMEIIEDFRILSIEQLKKEATYKEHNPELECYIVLGGLCKSSKDITYYPDDDTWDIFHYIDDSFVVYNSTEHMLKSTNILKAIENKCLIKD